MYFPIFSAIKKNEAIRARGLFCILGNVVKDLSEEVTFEPRSE